MSEKSKKYANLCLKMGIFANTPLLLLPLGLWGREMLLCPVMFLLGVSPFLCLITWLVGWIALRNAREGGLAEKKDRLLAWLGMGLTLIPVALLAALLIASMPKAGGP
jgi:hypothetical protein